MPTEIRRLGARGRDMKSLRFSRRFDSQLIEATHMTILFAGCAGLLWDDRYISLYLLD